MLKLLLLSTLVLSLQAEPTLQQLEDLSPNQKYILNETFKKAKEFGLEYSMTAIAWQESNFGNHIMAINSSTIDCGVFMINSNNLGSNNWKRSRVCERLIKDYDFSFATALQHLKYWQNYWKSKGVQKVWSHTIASYNKGFNYEYGTKYLSEIKERIRILKKFFKKDNR